MSAWKLFVFLISAMLGCLGGCEQAHTYPDDPIFASKQPTNSKPELKPPSVLAYVEPVRPTSPVQPTSSSTNGSSDGPMFAAVRGQTPE
jgi:hypothetical protein